MGFLALYLDLNIITLEIMDETIKFMRTQPKKPEIILRDGKPVSVILDIDVYQEMLEQIEAIEDLEALTKMRQEKV